MVVGDDGDGGGRWWPWTLNPNPIPKLKRSKPWFQALGAKKEQERTVLFTMMKRKRKVTLTLTPKPNRSLMVVIAGWSIV